MQINIVEAKTMIKNVNTYNQSSFLINLKSKSGKSEIPTMNRIEIIIGSKKK